MAKRAEELFEDEGAGPGRSSIDWTGFRDLWERQSGRVRNAGTNALTIGAVTSWVLALFVVYLTWNGASERPYVALQVPYLISGGFVTALLTAVGATLFLAGAIGRLGDAGDGDEPAPDPPRLLGGPKP